LEVGLIGQNPKNRGWRWRRKARGSCCDPEGQTRAPLLALPRLKRQRDGGTGTGYLRAVELRMGPRWGGNGKKKTTKGTEKKGRKRDRKAERAKELIFRLRAKKGRSLTVWIPDFFPVFAIRCTKKKRSCAFIKFSALDWFFFTQKATYYRRLTKNRFSIKGRLFWVVGTETLAVASRRRRLPKCSVFVGANQTKNFGHKQKKRTQWHRQKRRGRFPQHNPACAPHCTPLIDDISQA